MARPAASERQKRLRALQKKFSRKTPRDGGFLENRIGPAWPPEAFYFRLYATFEDALNAYAANRTPPSWAGVKTVKAPVWLPDSNGIPVRRLVEAIREKESCQERPRADGSASPADLVKPRREAVAVLLAALESGGPQAVIDKGAEWSVAHLKKDVDPFEQLEDPSPEICVAAELRILGPRLHMLYYEPRRFFQEAPQIYPEAFDVDSWPYKIGNLLFTWGVAVLTSPLVSEVFSRLSDERRSAVLDEAQGRVAFDKGGRPRLGVTDEEIAGTRAGSRAHVAEYSPEELRLDRTIYPETDDDGEPVRKRTTPEAAVDRLTALDLEMSVKTLKRRLGKKKS